MSKTRTRRDLRGLVPTIRARRLGRLAAPLALALSLTAALLPTQATAAPNPARPDIGVIVTNTAQHTISMCGAAYCATLALDHQAVVTNLKIGGRETLDPAKGIYSVVQTAEATASSRQLAAAPSVTVNKPAGTVVVSYATALTDEVWTFRVGAGQLTSQLDRAYRKDLAVSQQGTPMMTFAEDAFDQMRWPGDGGNFPLGGPLVNTHQPSWLAAGAQFSPGTRTAKEQISYALLNQSRRLALRIDGQSNQAAASRASATEVWRSAEPAGKDLNVAVLTAGGGLSYAGGNPLGYGAQTTSNGSPVFKPAAVKAGEHDVVTQVFRPADYDSYYDLGHLNGVNEQALSHAINDYARWMMQDTNKGASTEQPQLQSEVPPLEMQWIGQLLELFPEPGAIRSYQAGLEGVRDSLIASSGKVSCCSPGQPGYWGFDYGDQPSGYALGVAKAYTLTGDTAWLRGMKDSVERSLRYLLDNWTDPSTHFVRNVDLKLKEAGYNNDYWESSTGTFDGYTTALLYEALTAWSRLEQGALGGDGTHFAQAAAAIKTSFNKDVADGGFWSPQTQTFTYGTGNQDALYLPVNAEVLKSDLTSRDRDRQITQAIERQNAAGNYDLHPMNVRDLFTKDKVAPTAGKGGEDGGWYGAPDGDYYAGLPTLGDPQALQTAIASFLTRYQADGFYGATTWDRDNPLSRTAAGLYFPTTVMPAWGLYHYGYGFQPQDDQLVIAPYLTSEMSGSTVNYTWRGSRLRVGYDTPLSYRLSFASPVSTPITIRWINQMPGQSYRIEQSGSAPRTVRADANGNVDLQLAAAISAKPEALVTCRTCQMPTTADQAGSASAVREYTAAGAAARSDTYDQVGMQMAVGPRPVVVSSLGRYQVAGNHDVHRVKLLDVDGKVVASAPVDMARPAGRDGFVSTPLAKPVTLQPGLYYLYSSETPGGDTWFDAGGKVSTNPGITVLGAASGRDRTVSKAGTTSFGPVTFGYRQVGAAQPWIQALASPTSVRAASGQDVTFSVTVWGQANSPIGGSLQAVLPAGWTAQTPTFSIPTHGQPASVTVPLTVHVAATAPTATAALTVKAVAANGLRSERIVNVSVANILYDFNDGTTQGWQPGPKVAGMGAVANIANGPGTPFEGPYLLEVDSGTMSGADPRSIYVEPAKPLDLSTASQLYAHVNSYGAWPYTPRSYQATITLYNGTDKFSSTSDYEANVWNRIAINVSSWSGRNHVTRVEVTYTVNVDAPSYRLYFDLDSVGYDN